MQRSCPLNIDETLPHMGLEAAVWQLACCRYTRIQVRDDEWTITVWSKDRWLKLCNRTQAWDGAVFANLFCSWLEYLPNKPGRAYCSTVVQCLPHLDTRHQCACPDSTSHTGHRAWKVHPLDLPQQGHFVPDEQICSTPNSAERAICMHCEWVHHDYLHK